jgi:hypothetical protein
VHRAGAGGDQQRPSVVFFEQPRHRLGGRFVERIGAVAGPGFAFHIQRQHLAQQRVGGIAGPDALQIRRRYAQRKQRRGPPGGRQQVLG